MATNHYTMNGSAAEDVMPAEWQAFIEETRAEHPNIAAACDEAWGRGFDTEDVEGIFRLFSRGDEPGGVRLVLRDGDAVTHTGLY